ncbi:HD/PDEase domain containing protein [uncultured Caudovirales phage]|uniref:HD/PDEase domain containing protein n=1 Tax=uncultured Caudovirales phage TaxID=2100421 RepID=A0A6J5RXZ5_9CAUD|nr:HD/PDEase domain containing protein [uncultured Caudovirales phage]
MSSLQRILVARDLAVAAHGAQEYGPGLPYAYHLEKCQGVARNHVTGDMLEWAGVIRERVEISVWLHDTVEDTPLTVAMIRAIFGDDVADAVHAVTDVKGENRHARKHGTPGNPGPMTKLRSNRLGLIVKLVDRIANVEACISAMEKLPAAKRNATMLPKYRAEQVDLRALRTDGLGPLWDHLERILA